MNQKSNKSIEAVVEIEGFEDISIPWKVVDEKFYLIRIHGKVSDAEIGSVILRTFWRNSNEIINKTADETLAAFVADEGFVLPGGLIFKENDKIKVSPNCCCGLEDWHQWLEVPGGNTDIWTGHDPESLIEIEGGIIKIWQNIKNKAEKPSIDFTVEEMTEQLENVVKDLNDFLFRLGQWTKNIAPELEKKIVSHFAENMIIKI